MGSLKVLCLMLWISVYRAFCQIQLPEKASGESNVLPSTVSGRASNALREILNQESLVRFAMVQKIQSVVMDAINNKNDRQLMKAKLSVMTKDLKDLETKSQNMEAENNKLKDELKVMYGKVNDNRNLTKDVIQKLDMKMKSKTSALHDENLKQALKNLAYEKHLDLLNNTIKQMERSVGKDIETLKSSDMSTLERINTLNKLHAIEVIKNFNKVKELDDSFRNKSLDLENTDRGLTEGIEVLQDQMNEVNATLQISGVDVLARQIKKMEDTFSSFAVTVSEVLSIHCQSCWDILRKYPILKGRDGVYTLTIASEVKSVYCDMSTDGGGWTAIQGRQDGSTDFYRTWSEYKQGFGDPSKNYWIGNDAIYELTKNKDHELRVKLQSFDGGEAYAQYSTFYIGDEDTRYKLTVSGFSGTAGDSLTYNNGYRFTTKDQDNDGSDGDCATAYRGAWWYNNCAFANLNGQYGQSGETGWKYTMWYHWKDTESLKQTVMMIRHRN